MRVGMFRQYPPSTRLGDFYGECRFPAQSDCQRIQLIGVAVNQNLPARLKAQWHIRQIIVQHHRPAGQRFKAALIQAMLHIGLVANVEHRLMLLVQPNQRPATDLAIRHPMETHAGPDRSSRCQ